MIIDTIEGKIALVTGASQGIGKASSIALARSKARVILVARNKEKLLQTQAEINLLGGKSEVIVADFSREEQVNALFDQIEADYGTLDILINNAGIASKRRIEEVSMDEFDYMMKVNLRHVFLACCRAARLMKKKQDGYIINIASVSGFKAYEKQGAYGISKHGVMGLTKSLAVDLHADNIRISAIMPGGVDTEMMRNVGRADLTFSQLMNPDKIAHTILYLLSLWHTNAAVDQIYIRRKTRRPFCY